MTKTTMKNVTFSAPLLLRAQGDEKLATRFEGVAYSGDVVPSYGVVIDIDSTRIEAPMQLLVEHDRGVCAGVVEQATKQNGTLIVAGRLFSDIPGQAGEKIAKLAARGAPYGLSVGLFHYTDEFIGRGQSVTVNGRTVAGPATVLRAGRVREVSVVAVGADPNSTVKLLDGKHRMSSAADIYRRRNATHKYG